MDQISLFNVAPGLVSLWRDTDVIIDPDQRRIDFQVAFARGALFACPSCGTADQPVYDARERNWRRLNFFHDQAYVRTKVPRMRCESCGKTTQVAVPWARPDSGFSQLMDALIVTLCRAMPVRQVAQLLVVGDMAVWRILGHYVDGAREREELSSVQVAGLDKTASRRGQDYISLFHDLEASRVAFACEGRTANVVDRFTEDLEPHGGCAENVGAMCIDMSAGCLAGVKEHLLWATVTFDEYRVIALVNQALEEVRREVVRHNPVLKRSRYIWLKDSGKWARAQLFAFHDLSRQGLKTHRAFRLKKALRDIFATAQNAEEAEVLLEKWYRWARLCRLEPMKRLAATLKTHWQGILNAFDSRLTNGRVEAINSLIQAAKARARGYRTTRYLITLAYLIVGKPTHLPASHYHTTCWGWAHA